MQQKVEVILSLSYAIWIALPNIFYPVIDTRDAAVRSVLLYSIDLEKRIILWCTCAQN